MQIPLFHSQVVSSASIVQVTSSIHKHFIRTFRSVEYKSGALNEITECRSRSQTLLFLLSLSLLIKTLEVKTEAECHDNGQSHTSNTDTV